MRLGLVLAIVVGACGGNKPAQSSVTVDVDKRYDVAWTPTIQQGMASAARPEISVEQLVPSFHEELRWPLSAMSHPELVPQFEIASVFAQPGVGWLELCERGVPNRSTAGRNRDELEYLRGWCAAIKGDADTACSKLHPLTTSPVLGIPAAVRTDLANIIASSGDVDNADKLINKHQIRDVEIIDTLAATYLELGMERDAYEINRRALDTSPVGSKAAVHCRRLVRDIVLGGGSGRTFRLAQLEDMATKPKLPDETCVRLDREAKCFVGPPENCDAYFRAENIDTRNTFLLAAYQAWPRIGTYQEWLEIVRLASLGADLPGAKEVVDVALDAAVKAAPSCAPKLMRAIVDYTGTLRDLRFKPELDRCNWNEAPTSSNDTSAPSTPTVATTTTAETTAPAAAAAPASAVPAAPANCDPAVAKQRALDNIKMGQQAAALAQFEASLRCKDDPHVRQLAFMVACASGNSPKAKLHYKLLTPTQQTRFGQICDRQKPPVDYKP